MTLATLYDSKHYVKNQMTFMSPKDLIQPFLSAAGHDGEPVSIEIQNEVINVNDDRSENIAYPRFKAEIDFGPSNGLPGYQSTMGLIVALDVSKPIIKAYTGQNVSACMNLCIFGADEIFTQDVLADRSSLIRRVQGYREEQQSQIERYAEIDAQLQETVLEAKDINEVIGRLVRKGRTLVGLNNITTAADLIAQRNSPYSISENGTITLDKLFNAVTYSIGTTKDLISKPNKTLHLAEIMLN